MGCTQEGTGCQEGTSKKVAIGVGVFSGILWGLLTGFFFGAGSVAVPKVYNAGVNRVYNQAMFDNVAVCSQWPMLPCSEQDGVLVDGWLTDNPALVINIAHHQSLLGENTTMPPLKVILTNTNEKWNTTFDHTQILTYFSTDFNQGISPGEYLWAPSFWAPHRSPQVFAEYINDAGLDALLDPIPDSNMTTAILKGTTVDNLAFGVAKGQQVEVLLLNLNTAITTYVIGSENIQELTEPLAKMTTAIATNKVLLDRVVEFVRDG